MKLGREIDKVLRSLTKQTKRMMKTSTKGIRWFNKKPLKIRAAIMIALVFVTAQIAPIIAGSTVDIYEGGWEVRTNIAAVFVNGVKYTESRQPRQMFYPWGDQYVKFDVDHPLTGVPNLVVDISAPREYYIDAHGDWAPAPNGVHFDHISKPVGDTYYFWDHYVFRFKVRVVAEPDYAVGGIGDDTDGEAVGLAGYKTAVTTVRTKFTLDPFVDRLIDGFSTETGNYTLDVNKVQAGIMSAKVAKDGVESGFVGYTEGVAPAGTGGKTIIADIGGTLNQYYILNPDDPPLNELNVPMITLIDVGGELAPAYKWIAGILLFGGVMYTYAVYYEYTVEVHAIATAGYDLLEGNMDEDIEDIDYDQDEGSDPIGALITTAITNLANLLEWAGSGLSGFLNSIGLGFLMPLLILAVMAIAGYLIIKKAFFKKATRGVIP